MSYYRQIDHVRYVSNLLEAAERLTTGRGESRISYEEIQEIYALAEDGPGITATELRTIQYIVDHYTLTDKAQRWLDEKMEADHQLSLDEQLRKILTEEFDVPDLNLIFSEEEFQAQRVQFGPESQKPTDLLRQALQVILNDDQEPRSIFNGVVDLPDLMDPEQFDNEAARKEAVQQRILSLLKTATLELLPIELPDNNPVDGEPIEENWEFFVLIPDFSRIGFFVIIPRDGETTPYVYRAA